ncbi:MAG: B12-binding domain-containing radical SAM protein [Candidatus Accumulibacter sp.]|nr:B12-binding domain-containing radical SAM protein [Accumulibacter sp.]
MKKLLIKLISPRLSLRPMDSEMKRKMAPPLSLVTLASLTPAPHAVYIEDENIGKINFGDAPDLVGVTVTVDTACRAIEIARRYRERGIKVVFGGIHASACSQEMTKHCDAVCVGEAEMLWGKILDDFLRGALQRLYFNSMPTDLSRVPVADWRFIKHRHRYLYNNLIVTSRGCPFRCEFCYNSCDYVVRAYRNRPVEDVLREIDLIGTKQIMFVDDNFIGDPLWVDAFLDRIMDRGLIWHAAASTNIIHLPGLIEKMAKAGCRSLFVGFESINEKSIRSVNKRQNRISEYAELVRRIHASGMMVNASLVFGFDDDTPEIFDRTLDWLVENRVETMTAHILTPYPGTALYKRLESEGRIICRDLEKYNTAYAVFQPKNFTPEQLEAAYRKIYREFYSWRNIMRRRPLDRQMFVSYFLFNFGYRKYGRLISLAGRLGLMNFLGKLARKLAYGI